MKHSEYFEGKVQSLSITGKFGNATVGVIEPGQYTFGTASQETMTVVEGQ
ncbi:MAG TPA: pyrimidine/purine nucleoside phosphorylase, partial [Candidatus Goldiibacteriota bacterium]|nr:pyrimidine/purine nucleoside phosphorylase [Candidatus Goldiibacteriota bacterium]